MWTSDKKASDSDVPLIAPDVRRKALNSLLGDIFTDSTQAKLAPRSAFQQKRISHTNTAEHIFSHIRHTLWIESKEIMIADYAEMPCNWTDAKGRQVRWMNKDEMDQVGITSEVKKILKAVGTIRDRPNKRQRTK